MSIPTSLIVVLLVVAWLVVLVPMIAKRRDKVPQSEPGGNGFRVLRRAQATLKRRPKRAPKADAGTPPADQAPDLGAEKTLVTVGGAADPEPQDAAEEWAAAQAGHRPAVAPERPTEFEEDGYRDAEYDEPSAVGSGPVEEYAEAVTAFPHSEAPDIPPEVDEQEWVEHAAAASAPMHRLEVNDDALRPTPRRRGRGGYDPEAAEATRAYRYRQRRRVTLVLSVATVVFTLAAFLLASSLWVGAVISCALLAGYLTYLRRQVKIEAQIRQRRMERLQRARQIRPEYGRGRPSVRAGRSAAGPGRTVVDLDDDDPGFDHLEPYDPPVTYRRAAGQ